MGRAESAEVVLHTAESAGKRLNLLKMCAESEIRLSTCVARYALAEIHTEVSSFTNTLYTAVLEGLSLGISYSTVLHIYVLT